MQKLILLSAFVLLLVAMTSKGASAQSPDAVADLAARVNRERLAQGLVPYALNAKLTAAAQAHANDIARTGNFSHTGSDGSTVFDRVARTGYGAYSWGRRLGENWAWYHDAATAMAQWMDSSPHRANILHALYREIGIGIAPSQGNTVFVIDFGAQPNVLPVLIDDGAGETRALTVTLTLSNEDVMPNGDGSGSLGRATQVEISNSPDFAGAVWQSFAPHLAWTLASGSGTKSVYVKYRDAAGRTATASDSISFSVPVTSTPRPTATRTRTPRPSATPTAAPVPTNVSIPVPTPQPGLYVSAMRLSPAQPAFNQNISFTPTFVNATSTVQNFNWKVYIWRADTVTKNDNETTAQLTGFPVGTGDFPALGSYRYGPTGFTCEYFFARVGWLDANNKVTYFTKPDGTDFNQGFKICDVNIIPTGVPQTTAPTETPPPELTATETISATATATFTIDSPTPFATATPASLASPAAQQFDPVALGAFGLVVMLAVLIVVGYFARRG